MSESYALQMPSNYVPMDNDEMEYLEGGNGWYNKRSTVAAAIDIAIICVTLGKSLCSQATAKKILSQNRGTIAAKARNKVIGMFGSKAGSLITGAIEIALTAFGTSIGGLIAYGIDYMDGNRLNGYCFG